LLLFSGCRREKRVTKQAPMIALAKRERLKSGENLQFARTLYINHKLPM